MEVDNSVPNENTRLLGEEGKSVKCLIRYQCTCINNHFQFEGFKSDEDEYSPQMRHQSDYQDGVSIVI